MTALEIIESISKTKILVEKAIRLDNDGQIKAAIELYLQAAESLIETAKLGDEHNPQLASTLRQKAKDYLKRVKHLKEEELTPINGKPMEIRIDQFTELEIERVLAKYPILLTGILHEKYRVLGRQVKTADGKRLDILIQDPAGKLAVIELKMRKARMEDVDQVLDYVRSIRKYGQVDLGNSYMLVNEVYGFLIAPEFDTDVYLYALKQDVIPRQLDVRLVEKILLANAFGTTEK